MEPIVLRPMLSPQWGWICLMWEGVCVSMYVLVLCVLHIVRDSLTSVSAILEEVALQWKLQVWPLRGICRHADHLYTKTLNNYSQLPVNSKLVILGCYEVKLLAGCLLMKALMFSPLYKQVPLIQLCSIWDTCVHASGFVCAWLCMCEWGCIVNASVCVCVFM